MMAKTATIKRKILTILLPALLMTTMPVFPCSTLGAPKGLGESAPDPDFHIYLAFGQSNMTGDGIIEEQDRNCNDDLLVMCTTDSFQCAYNPEIRSLGNWYKATPPLAGPTGSRLGVADYFGRSILEMKKEKAPDIKVGILVVAVPGTGIRLFDKDKYQAYCDSLPPEPKGAIDFYRAEYGGSPYQRLVECAEKAKKKGVIKGIIMHQGESDYLVPGWKEEVEKIYEDLTTDLELPKDLPFVAGEMRRGTLVSDMNLTINELPQLRKNFYVVSSDNLSDTVVNEGNVHFTSEEYRVFGKRYAEKMLEAEGFSVPDKAKLTEELTTEGDELKET